MTYSFHAQLIVVMDDEEKESRIPQLNIERIEKMLNKKKFKKVKIDQNAFGAFNPIITIDARSQKKELKHV